VSAELPRHEPRPGLYEPLLRRFALAAGERRTGLWLLRLLRVPGMARLMLAWHARRGRRG
jgi:hypothetical protein